MNKTILITGSTDGIGKLAAIKIARENHSIYLHGRNAKKLEQVILEIKDQTGNDKITGFVADFSDLNAVTEMAKKIKNEVPVLDILINNAGVFKSPHSQTTQGFDTRIAVNYFAPFLLTHELLPLLINGVAPRLINLSSAAQSTVSLDVLSGASQANFKDAYAQSKLALTMWTFYLAKTQKEIISIALNPGSLLNTNMVREGFGRYWSSAEKGGNILYDLALSKAYDNDSGKYFDNDKGEQKGAFGKAHIDAYDDIAIDKLIYNTKKTLGLF